MLKLMFLVGLEGFSSLKGLQYAVGKIILIIRWLNMFLPVLRQYQSFPIKGTNFLGPCFLVDFFNQLWEPPRHPLGHLCTNFHKLLYAILNRVKLSLKILQSRI